MTNNKPNVLSLDEVLRAAVSEGVAEGIELGLRRTVAELKAHIDSRMGGSTVSVKQAAEILGVCEDIVRARIIAGELKGIRPNGPRSHWRVYRSSLEGMTDVEVEHAIDVARAGGAR